MAIPQVPCVKRLLKTIIVIVIILALLAAAVCVVGLLKVSTLKLDTLEIAEGVTLADAGLQDEKFFTIIKAAWNLCKAKESQYITNPYTQEDRTEANEMFSKLLVLNGVPKYSSLLYLNASLNKGGSYLYEVSDGMLAYIFNQIFASTDVNTAYVSSIGMQAESVTIAKENKTLSVAFSLDITSISSTLPDLKIVKWPEKAFVTYKATMSVDSEGAMSLSNAEVSLDGLDQKTTEAVFMAVCKVANVEKTGDKYTTTISDSIGDVLTKSINHIGKIGKAGIDSETSEIIANTDPTYGESGIKEGAITFIMHS